MSTKSAIDAQRLNAFLVEPEKLTLVTDPEHALYDPRVHLPVDENLVLNIMVHGVREAIHLAKDGDKLLVAAGRRRVKATIEANKRLRKDGREAVKIRAFVERGDDGDMMGVMILENEFRREDSPMVKAKKALRLLNLGKSEDEVAVMYGVAPATLRAWLSLLELAAPVQKAVEAGTVGTVAAATLAKLPKAEQAEALESLLEAGGGTTKARQTVAKRKGREVKERPSAKDLQAAFVAADGVAKSKVTAEIEAIRDTLAWVLGERKTPPAELAACLKSSHIHEQAEAAHG